MNRSHGTPPGRLRLVTWAAVALFAAVLVAGRAHGALSSPGVGLDAVTDPVTAAVDDLGGRATRPLLITGPDRTADAPLPDGGPGTARTWWAHGRWWAVLPDTARGGSHWIWVLDGPDGPWTPTGTLVDDRPDADLDVVWTGEGLVVAATGRRDYRSHRLLLSRFRWDAADERWHREADHPVPVTEGGAPDTRVDVTADGVVWMARPGAGGGIDVARTEGTMPAVTAWSAVPGVDGDAGGFDVVARDEELDIVWRSRHHDRLGVATRRAGRWEHRLVGVAGVAGVAPIEVGVHPDRPDQLLVLAARPDPDDADAVARPDPTAGGDSVADVVLVVVAPGPEPPTVSVVSRAGDGLRQPALVLTGPTVRIVALAPPSREGRAEAGAAGREPTATVVEKDAALADLRFDPGRGRVLVDGVDGADATRPFVPGAVLPAEAGLVLVTSAAGVDHWATWTDGSPSEPVPVAADDRAATVLVDDTFESRPVGAPAPAVWVPDGDVPVGRLVDDARIGDRSLRLDGAGPDGRPAGACRSVPDVGAAVVVVEAVVVADGYGEADARLLTVRGPAGPLASVRWSRAGAIGWSTPEGRVTPAVLGSGSVVLVTVEIDLDATVASIRVSDPNGADIVAADRLPWLTPGPGPVEEACVRAAPGAGTALALGTLRVTAR